MKGIFVNEDGGVPYAHAIVEGRKPIETRSRNMLRQLLGDRVAIVCTRRAKSPTIVGYATISTAIYYSAEKLDEMRDLTLIPEGSKYDCKIGSKWCYFMEDPETCDPYPLPDNAVRHGLSWCEW